MLAHTTKSPAAASYAMTPGVTEVPSPQSMVAVKSLGSVIEAGASKLATTMCDDTVEERGWPSTAVSVTGMAVSPSTVVKMFPGGAYG